VAVIAGQTGAFSPWFGLGPAAVVLLLGTRRPLRRWRLARQGLPADGRRWLEAHVPLYGRLGADARARFERDVRFLVDEISFEGVQGVDVTDELRLGVAAGAALLLHGRPDWELPSTPSVLFYPGRFDDAYYGGEYADYDGMAHEQGPIILTASAVKESWADAGDGNNVVLHELAHLFDFDNEGPDGVPSLVDPSAVDSWQALVRREMRRIEHGRSVLRPYAAEAPSEFFAVAVEVFFEQPERLARHHDALFDALRSFFALDPRTGQAPVSPSVRDDPDEAPGDEGAGPGGAAGASDGPGPLPAGARPADNPPPGPGA
jgi:Mlc titration factor MtfA (ptsG expression regulator)